MSELDVLSRAARIRLSGIVCTIGPVSREPEFLYDMMEAGMNIARMNFSHGTHEYHKKTIENCRVANDKYCQDKGFGIPLAIALDTKGPEIRTGKLEGDTGKLEVTLETGAAIKITTDDAFMEKCTKDILWVDYKNINKVLKPGKRMYIDDGLISVVAKEIGDNFVMGEIENGGNLGSRKGCNLPGTDCDLPAVSEKDKADLLFGVEMNVDMVFASFIRDAQGVKDVREVLGKAGEKILIISKVENQQGVKNIDEIIAENEGVMVARGDMGIEIPPEKVFIAQKQMIAKCNKVGKPVICATQMLESMVKKPRPTRAEVSDVANAVLDGSDCVMLSGETAKGDYPLACIRTMGGISREAEACIWNRKFFEDLNRSLILGSPSMTMDVTTTTSVSAAQASRFRPMCPIIAVTRFHQVARQMQLHRGIMPLFYEEPRPEDWIKDVDNRIQFGVDFGKNSGFLKSGDAVICITGWRKGAGSSNTIRILTIQ